MYPCERVQRVCPWGYCPSDKPMYPWRYKFCSVCKSVCVTVCEVSTVSDDLGCHVICWCWSTVFSEVHSQRSHLPGNFCALHASFCWQALWRCWFHFPAGLGTCSHCQRYQKLVSMTMVFTVINWSANSPDLNPIENLDERHQTQRCIWAEGHCQRNLGFHTTSAVPQTDHLHATPNWGSN